MCMYINVISYQIIINQCSICRKAYSSVLGTSMKCLKSIFEDYKANVTYLKTPKKIKISDKYSITFAWMKDYFSRFGETMPHVNQVTMNFINKHFDVDIPHEV